MSTAMDAALAVGAEYGYDHVAPHVLQDTNNVVVWLRPHTVIAKVSTRVETRSSIEREHRVCLHLDACGAPVRRPLPGTAVDVRGSGEFVVSLWEYLEDSGVAPTAPELARSLRELHGALATYPGWLPTFRDSLQHARTALGNDGAIAALSDTDLQVLRDGFATFLLDLDEYAYAEQALHGEPHLDNVLSTEDGPRWIDLEAASRGPVEWDLASCDESVASLFPEVDHDLLALLRRLNSARVATWCWIRSDAPGMRQHAEHHLQVVRESLG